MTKIVCPRCKSPRLYKLTNGKRRCAACKYEFTPHRLPLTLSRDEWKEIIHLFLEEKSSNVIAEETGLELRRVLRAMTRIREGMLHDIPKIFSGYGNLNVIDTKNFTNVQRKTVPLKKKKQFPIPGNHPVFGICCKEGMVMVSIIDDARIDPSPFRSAINHSISPGVFPNSWRVYNGIATRSSVYLLKKLKKNLFTNDTALNNKELEEFWTYLRRRLTSKGGVRRERLNLFLAEYVWVYNHRLDQEWVKIQKIIRLLEKYCRRK